MSLFHSGDEVYLIDAEGKVQRGTIRKLFQRDGCEFAKVGLQGEPSISVTRETEKLTPVKYPTPVARPAATSNRGAESEAAGIVVGWFGKLLLVAVCVALAVGMIWLAVTVLRWFWQHPLF
jgi:hypothetical protein